MHIAKRMSQPVLLKLSLFRCPVAVMPRCCGKIYSIHLNHFGRHFYYPTYNIHTYISQRRVGLTQRLDKILTVMPGCAWTILGITHC